MANRHRPRRGPAGANVLVDGDIGTTAGAQGGAAPGASESGNLDSREFGVPQADIPGGLRHLVNPETVPEPTAAKPLRPADEHKFHGVPPDDFGQYAMPPGTEEDKPAKAEPEPRLEEAVPVYIVEQGGKAKVRRNVFMDSILVAVAGSDPTRLCNQDNDRVEVKLLNEDSSVNVRFSSERSDLAESKGTMLPAVTNTYLTVPTQSELWAVTVGASTAKVSVMLVTEVTERQ